MDQLLKWSRPFVLAVFIGGIAAGGVLAGQTGVSQSGAVTTYTPPSDVVIDYQHAKPMPLPMAHTKPLRPLEGGVSVQKSGVPKFVPGSPGTGVMTPETWTPPVTKEAVGSEADIVTPQEYGTSNHPFTTSRVDLSGNSPSNRYPYRAAGKLYFKIGADTYVCSASLIDKGIIVTAAHCVADFGASTFYSGWKYVPAQSGATRPYGTWSVKTAYVLGSYLNGTDSCAEAGIVCENDVAVLVAAPKLGVYPGRATGWFGYGWDGWGFAPTSPNSALINQLGYPVTHDGGLKMQRTDSLGYVDSTSSNNTVWGSRQTGGSSGGPELVNLGKAAVLSGTDAGTDGDYNIVVGVTSWGYTSTLYKEQGASPFTSSNIGDTTIPDTLVYEACAAYPKACTLPP